VRYPIPPAPPGDPAAGHGARGRPPADRASLRRCRHRFVRPGRQGSSAAPVTRWPEAGMARYAGQL